MQRIRIVLAVVVLMTAFSLTPPTGVQAQTSADPSFLPFGAACAYLKNVKTFTGTFSLGYSNSFVETTTSGSYSYTRSVSGAQGGTGESTLNFYSNGTLHHWVGTPVRGNGDFSLIDVASDTYGPRYSYRTVGNGPMISGSQSVSIRVLDAANCRFGIFIEAVVLLTSNNNPNYTGAGYLGGLRVNDVTVVRDGSTVRFVGGGAYPAYTGSIAGKTAYFTPVGLSAIVDYFRRQGAETAGAGNGSWDFGAQLETDLALENVTLEHENYPSRDWVTIGSNGTTDGNQVRITARINNGTGQQQNVLLDVAETLSNRTIPGCPTQISVPPTEPGKPFEARCIWDTSGWAWRDTSGQVPAPLLPQPATDRVIKVNFIPTGKPSNAIETPITVRPRPVVLVHDMLGSPADWQSYRARFGQVTPKWLVATPQIQAGTSWSNPYTSVSVDANADLLRDAIEQLRSAQEAWHFDLVGHGYGGLVARAYIHYHMANHPTTGRPSARNLVMIGTPNQGTPCASRLVESDLAADRDPAEVFFDQTPALMSSFNAEVTNLKGVRAFAAAGYGEELLCAPIVDPVPLGAGVATVDPVPLVPMTDGWVTTASALGSFTGVEYRLEHFALIGGSTAAGTLWMNEVLVRLGERAPETGAAVASGIASMSATAPTSATVIYSQAIDAVVAANGSIDIPLRAPAADGMAIMLINTGAINAELRNPAGVVVDSAGAGRPLRRLQAREPVAGVWMLRLANGSAQAVTVRGLVALGGTAFHGEARSVIKNGKLMVSAALFDRQEALHDATVTVALASSGGERLNVALRDDGANGDETANDGVYSAQVAAPAGLVGAGVAKISVNGAQWMLPVEVAMPARMTQVFLPLLLR